MTRRYLNADASTLLDAWVEASGVVPAMTLEGVSFWYGARLGHWLWLVDQLLWINVLDDLLGANPGVREITCDAGTDAPLVAAAQARGRARRADHRRRGVGPGPGHRDARGHHDRPRTGERPAPPPDVVRRPAPLAVPAARAGAATAARRETPQRDRRASRPDGCSSCRRTRSSASTPRPDHGSSTRTSARCSTACGAAASTRSRSTCARPWRIPTRKWAQLESARPLPQPPARRHRHPRGQDDRQRSSRATRRAPAPTGSSPAAAALEVSGVDLGPSLARIVADRVAGSLGRRIVDVDRIRALLRRTHARGDPARRRVPPPGLAGRRRRRGRAGRRRPARRHLPAAHGLHPPHPAAGAAAPRPDLRVRALGAGRADPHQRVPARGGGRRRLARLDLVGSRCASGAEPGRRPPARAGRRAGRPDDRAVGDLGPPAAAVPLPDRARAAVRRRRWSGCTSSSSSTPPRRTRARTARSSRASPRPAGSLRRRSPSSRRSTSTGCSPPPTPTSGSTRRC